MQESLDIVFLQETHFDRSNEADWGIWWKGKYVPSHVTNVSAGVAVLFSPHLSVNIISVKEAEQGRLLVVQASIQQQTYTLICVYAPNEELAREAFFSKLHKELLNLTQGSFLIMAGDWNCTVDFRLDRNGEEPHLNSARVLRRIIKRFDLLDVWRIKHSNRKWYTWLRVAGQQVSAARLDRMYIQSNYNNRLVTVGILPVPLSDHHMVTTRFSYSRSPKIAVLEI